MQSIGLVVVPINRDSRTNQVQNAILHLRLLHEAVLP